jgi:hypothetical protein
VADHGRQKNLSAAPKRFLPLQKHSAFLPFCRFEGLRKTAERQRQKGSKKTGVGSQGKGLYSRKARARRHKPYLNQSKRFPFA